MGPGGGEFSPRSIGSRPHNPASQNPQPVFAPAEIARVDLGRANVFDLGKIKGDQFRGQWCRFEVRQPRLADCGNTGGADIVGGAYGSAQAAGWGPVVEHKLNAAA